MFFVSLSEKASFVHVNRNECNANMNDDSIQNHHDIINFYCFLEKQTLHNVIGLVKALIKS